MMSGLTDEQMDRMHNYPVRDDAKVREAGEVANEIADALTDDGAYSWTDCSNAARLGFQRGHAAGIAEGGARVGALEQAAAEYRAATLRVSNAIARVEAEEPSDEVDAELLAAQDEYEVADARLAALLPAEGAKGAP